MITRPGSARRRSLRGSTPIATLLLAAVSVTACATTVVDDTESTEATVTADAEAGVAAPPADEATSNDPPTGSTDELLTLIEEEWRGLSELIVGDGDERASLDRIEQAWATARSEVAQRRPDLSDDVDAMVDMARTAVTTRRPADADKSFVILVDLLAAYADPE